MKTFKTHLTEKAVDGGYPVDTDSFSNDLANPKNIERINSFLGAMGGIEYLIPEHAMNKIRERLGRLAISFGDVDLSEDGGRISIPLTQFGGRFGKDEEGNDINDDGISHRVEGGLSIEIMHEKTGAGTHFVRAKIV
tara:strand:- start:5588 stop:5998 length:411 start_codon:yes stop_codon:yes gene_type:complete